jgi:outer membrane protein OmpA-like peptidoglycan-associated protein
MMNPISKSLLLSVTMLLLSVTMYSCKTKKVIAKAAPAPVAQEAAPVEAKTEPAPVPEKEEPAPAPKPDYNFTNVQFEFNSDVLKTSSFQSLDQAAAQMKIDPNAKFILNGHSSAEGSVEHNMSLSVDRANAVKSYLVNAGVNAANFEVKGFGATQPLAKNDTEESRAINRRVEVKFN